MSRRNARYGWVPDLPDQRDIYNATWLPAPRSLPPRVDLRPLCPPVYDQEEIGSCTANAIAAAIQYNQLQHRLPSVFTPSRLFIYYNERALEGTVDSDSGAQLRDGLKSAAAQGVCPEPLWPYNIARFRDRPPPICYDQAKSTRVAHYQRIPQEISHLKASLAQGHPFLFGMTAYESFEDSEVAHSGCVEMPQATESALGGHAVLAVGYDDANCKFLVRNSWGSTWGIDGYFTLPYAYLSTPSLARDFWTIRRVDQIITSAASHRQVYHL